MAARKMQFVVDAKGRTTGVILSMKEYRALLDRIAELREQLGLTQDIDVRKQFSFIGSGASGRSDISARHDEALDDDFA